MPKKNTKKKFKKKDVYEVFKLEKDGKAKTVRVHGLEEVKPGTNKQVKEENKILRNLIVIVVIFILAVLSFALFIKSVNNFNYRGVDFKVVKEGNLIFYQTSFPVTYQGENAVYNIYIRNDPRKLDEQVPFNGKLFLLGNIVLNTTENFNCDGDGVIAIANLLKMEIFGMNIFKNESLGCDSEGKYTYITTQNGDETRIDRFGPSCYNIQISNCEILKGTERFMVESFVKVNEEL